MGFVYCVRGLTVAIEYEGLHGDFCLIFALGLSSGLAAANRSAMDMGGKSRNAEKFDGGGRALVAGVFRMAALDFGGI